MDKTFLDNYSGQSTAELLEMKNEYRIDSLVLAFEQGIQEKPESEVSESEGFVLAIEAMEREVNNGGWEQFFDNTEGDFNDVLPRALDAIRCPGTAQLAREAIDAHQSAADLAELDDKYYGLSEYIGDRLFEYIEAHADEVNLP